MVIRVGNGRRARGYFHDPGFDPLMVTYWRRVNGRMRQLTISAKLMRKVLR